MKAALYLNKKGMTLIELVIGMGLLGLVLMIAYSLFFFGTSSFELGLMRGDLQQNARLVKDFITEEIRYAREVEILETVNTDDENSHYIYVEKNAIKHKVAGEDPLVKFSSISEKVDFELEVGRSDARILNVTVVATDKEDDENRYSLTNDVLILNIGARGEIIDESSDGEGIGIRYQLPD